jgi:hypothetical protein
VSWNTPAPDHDISDLHVIDHPETATFVPLCRGVGQANFVHVIAHTGNFVARAFVIFQLIQQLANLVRDGRILALEVLNFLLDGW